MTVCSTNHLNAVISPHIVITLYCMHAYHVMTTLVYSMASSICEICSACKRILLKFTTGPSSCVFPFQFLAWPLEMLAMALLRVSTNWRGVHVCMHICTCEYMCLYVCMCVHALFGSVCFVCACVSRAHMHLYEGSELFVYVCKHGCLYIRIFASINCSCVCTMCVICIVYVMWACTI